MYVGCACECAKVGSGEWVWFSLLWRFPGFPQHSLLLDGSTTLYKRHLAYFTRKRERFGSWKVARLCAVTWVSKSGPCMRRFEETNITIIFTNNKWEAAIRVQWSVPNGCCQSQHGIENQCSSEASELWPVTMWKEWGRSHACGRASSALSTWREIVRQEATTRASNSDWVKYSPTSSLIFL